ncbi:MAG: RNB domain-containing ribonuclease, partial [Candidatus Angelobacter sp.]
MNNSHPSHVDLQAAARQIMLENGFEPEFPPEVAQQLAQLDGHPPQAASGGEVRDLRHLPWSSIDNDTSRDLDQIEVAEKLSDGTTKVMIGIADVDAFVSKETPIDLHAGKETTTVYAGVRNFPMLPERLSTGATSLLEGNESLCVVTEFSVDGQSEVVRRNLYRAVVRNHAQLTYNAVGAWLEDRGPAPQKIAQSPELRSQLKLQDEAAQALRNERYRHGALNIETDELHAMVLKDNSIILENQGKNRATDLI